MCIIGHIGRIIVGNAICIALKKYRGQSQNTFTDTISDGSKVLLSINIGDTVGIIVGIKVGDAVSNDVGLSVSKAKTNTAGLTLKDTMGLSKHNVARRTIMLMAGHTVGDTVGAAFGDDS